MSSVKFKGSLQERSTSAAREYVAAVRNRLHSEVAMHGEPVRTSRSFRELERTITPHEIRRVWPHADVDKALAGHDDTP